jgi:hypothetical protein
MYQVKSIAAAIIPHKAPQVSQVYGAAPHVSVHSVEASEIKVVNYKGKQLLIKVFDDSDIPSQLLLEYYYQQELKKEKNLTPTPQK